MNISEKILQFIAATKVAKIAYLSLAKIVAILNTSRVDASKNSQLTDSVNRAEKRKLVEEYIKTEYGFDFPLPIFQSTNRTGRYWPGSMVVEINFLNPDWGILKMAEVAIHELGHAIDSFLGEGRSFWSDQQGSTLYKEYKSVRNDRKGAELMKIVQQSFGSTQVYYREQFAQGLVAFLNCPESFKNSPTLKSVYGEILEALKSEEKTPRLGKTVVEDVLETEKKKQKEEVLFMEEKDFPSNPQIGKIYYDLTKDRAWYWNGLTWNRRFGFETKAAKKERIISKIQNLHGIHEKSQAEKKSYVKRTLEVWKDSKGWHRKMTNENTTFWIHPLSIGEQFHKGAKKTFTTLTTYECSKMDFFHLVGAHAYVWDGEKKKYVQNPDIEGGYMWYGWSPEEKGSIRISLTAATPEWIRAKLGHEMMNFVNRGSKNPYHIIPAYPAWIFGKGGEFNFLVSKTPLDLPMDVLIRAGKDIWGAPEKVLASSQDDKVVRLYVCAATGTIEGDGNFFLHGEDDGLARFSFEYQGVKCLGKGRIMNGKLFNHLPDGQPCPKGVHGWTTIDNLKWLTGIQLDSLVGTVIEVPIFNIVKDEDHARKEAGYKWSAASILMMKMDDVTLENIVKMFQEHWLRLSEKHQSLTLAKMVKELKDDTNGAVLSSQAVKMFKGLATPDDINAVVTAFAKKYVAKHMKDSEYPMIVYANCLHGMSTSLATPLVSADLFDRLYAVAQDWKEVDGRMLKIVTGLRQPATGHQSYGGLILDPLNRIPENLWNPKRDLMVLHPSDAPYHQGDGDDHIALFVQFITSFFSWDNEDILVAKPPIRKGKVDPVLAYMKGAAAQGSIGYAFNAMLKAQVMHMEKHFLTSAMAINAFAQGVKKDAILPEPSELLDVVASDFSDTVEAYRVNEFADKESGYEAGVPFDMALAGLITSKRKPQKFHEFAQDLGFKFGSLGYVPNKKDKDKVDTVVYLNDLCPKIGEQTPEIDFGMEIKTFNDAKKYHESIVSSCAKVAGFAHIGQVKATMVRSPELWSVSDWCMINVFFNEYNNRALDFRTRVLHKQSGLVVQQISGVWLAIQEALLDFKGSKLYRDPTPPQGPKGGQEVEVVKQNETSIVKEEVVVDVDIYQKAQQMWEFTSKTAAKDAVRSTLLQKTNGIETSKGLLVGNYLLEGRGVILLDEKTSIELHRLAICEARKRGEDVKSIQVSITPSTEGSFSDAIWVSDDSGSGVRVDTTTMKSPNGRSEIEIYNQYKLKHRKE